MIAERVLEAVRADGLLPEAGPVVVMFSGGRDSTCLLDLAVALAGSAHTTALHVNYGLRDSADADERHCAQACAALGIGFEVRRPRRPETGNIQAWARDERYRAAAELAQTDAVRIAAGHTATDQLETILYRLASSPSRRALLGMKPREGRLIRPLLRFTRADTASYCTERGLDWREDETNVSDAYARGRIRATLVPALETIHPAAAQNVLALAEILRDEATVLDSLVDEVLQGRAEIDLARLRALAPALQRLVLQRLADESAGRPAPGTARRAAEVVAMAPNAMLDLPHGVRAVAERGVLRFESHTTEAPRRARAGS